MRRALELARRGWGRVAPNPLVGAVLCQGGRIVGEGYHAEFGGPHAEVRALDACADPAGSTCVVTLEPCAHTGKTAPCADALIAAGVARVVFALKDPDPEAGGGGQRLREAGIDVEEGLCREEAAALNAPFLWLKRRPERPFVALKLATSLDGFLTDKRGRSRWISGPPACAWVHWLRAGYDAVAVGRRTAEVDDPQLTVRGSLEPRTAPKRVVFARTGPVQPELHVVRTAGETPTIVITSPGSAPAVTAALRSTAVEVHGARDLTDGLRVLRGLGIGSLLVEGGGMLAGALLEAGLVDRLYWIQAPLWLGEGTPAFGRRTATLLEDARSWTVVERGELGVDTLLVVDREPCLPE